MAGAAGSVITAARNSGADVQMFGLKLFALSDPTTPSSSADPPLRRRGIASVQRFLGRSSGVIARHWRRVVVPKLLAFATSS